jgi:hypothetical protein
MDLTFLKAMLILSSIFILKFQAPSWAYVADFNSLIAH